VTHDKNNAVWSQAGLSSPFDPQRLPNGNTLIAHAQGVMEVDREGKTVWQERGAGASSVYRY